MGFMTNAISQDMTIIICIMMKKIIVAVVNSLENHEEQ